MTRAGYHMFYLLLPTLELRQGLIAHLRQRDILSVFHYLPLHLSDMGRRFGGQAWRLPRDRGVSDQLLRLPFHNSVTDEDQQRVIEAILGVRSLRTPPSCDNRGPALDGKILAHVCIIDLLRHISSPRGISR